MFFFFYESHEPPTKRIRHNSIAPSAAAAVDIANSGNIQFVSTRYVCTHPDQSPRSSCLMIGSQTPQVVQQLQTQLFSALSHENEVLQQQLVNEQHRHALLQAERVRIDDQNDADAIRLRSALSSVAHTIGLL